ncbi:MAG TPA: hypothetical protein VL402_12615 [Xanthobacteraceae bacterium]|jgi:hypothetical protein|nr:hypothetical protein [Xanthobacteraceae bacterium]
MRGLRILGVAAIGSMIGATGSPAQAQNRPVVAAAALAKTPQRYLNTPIVMHDLYCYSDAGHYECRTKAPLRIVLDSVKPGAARTAMEKECGALDGIEQSPTCRFTLELVPTESSRRSGDYTRRDKLVTGPMVFVTATAVSARKD